MSLDSRVKWFRARADRDRWQEDVEILEEELKRIQRGFTAYSDLWTQVASQESEGKAAYAYRKAAMYRVMAANAAREAKRADNQ